MSGNADNSGVPYEEGKVNSHDPLDSSMLPLDSIMWTFTDDIAEDERSIANRLAAEEVGDNMPHAPFVKGLYILTSPIAKG